MMRIVGWKNMLSGHFVCLFWFFFHRFFIIQFDVRTQIQLANGRALKSIFSHLVLYKKGASWKVKFIYSEKATHFCEISTVDLFYEDYLVKWANKGREGVHKFVENGPTSFIDGPLAWWELQNLINKMILKDVPSNSVLLSEIIST